MNHVRPIFDLATHYRIEVRGRVDIDWLQSFDSLVEISFDKTRQIEEITELNVQTINRGSSGWCAGCTDWE